MSKEDLITPDICTVETVKSLHSGEAQWGNSPHPPKRKIINVFVSHLEVKPLKPHFLLHRLGAPAELGIFWEGEDGFLSYITILKKSPCVVVANFYWKCFS